MYIQKQYKIAYILHENDIFNVEFYKEDDELDILEKWMNKIGESISIEKTDIEPIDKNTKIFIENILLNNLSIKLYDMDKIKDLIDNIKSLYENKKYLKQDLYNDSSFTKENNDKNSLNSEFKHHSEYIYNKSNRNEFFYLMNGNDIDNSKQIKPLSNDNHFILNPYLNDDTIYQNLNYEIIDYNKNEDTDLLIMISNTKILITFIKLNPNSTELNFLKNNKYNFNIELKLKIKKNKQLVDIINNIANDKYYSHEDELKQKINNINDIINNNNHIIQKNEEELKVKTIINNLFIINNDIRDKIKANELFKIVESELISINFKIDNSISFRNRFSKYLINLGLQKKRFKDGFYYYGLINKFKTDNNQYNLDSKNLIDLTNENILDILNKKRQEELSLENIKIHKVELYNDSTNIQELLLE